VEKLDRKGLAVVEETGEETAGGGDPFLSGGSGEIRSTSDLVGKGGRGEEGLP